MLPPPIEFTSFQQRALSAYLSLTALQREWKGQLVLLEASAAAVPWAPAVLAAGGTVLLHSRDSHALREANETGATDFSVTSLAEAVRALKNEVRKGEPLSVGLLDGTGTALQEMVLRGLQPNALFPADCTDLAGQNAWQVLRVRGAMLLTEPNAAVAEPLVTHTADGWRERRAGDQVLLECFRKLPDPLRSLATQWLHAAARLFPRDLHRCYVPSWRASEEP